MSTTSADGGHVPMPGGDTQMQDERYSAAPAARQPSPRTPQSWPSQQSWPPQGISPYNVQPGWAAGQGTPPRQADPRVTGVRLSREDAIARANARRAPAVSRMSKAEALDRVASLKTAITWLSVAAFGAFAWLAAGRLANAGTAQTPTGGQTTQPGASGTSGDDGQQQQQGNNGGFFNQGGAGFGSGNTQQPSSGSGVS